MSSLLHSSYFFYCLLASLFFCNTNLVYISALASVFALIICPFLLWQNRTNLKTIYQIHDISFSCAVFYFYALVSLLITTPSSILDFSFYRYDGNFIISYALFLLLPFVSLQQIPIKMLFRWLIYLTVVIQLPFFIQHLLQLNQVNAYPYFHSLFASSNAAGGFFSLIIAFAIGLYWQERKSWLLLLCIFTLLCYLIASTSRGSLFALIGAIIFWQLAKYKQQKIIFLFLLLIILTQAALIHHFYPTYQQKIDYLSYQQILERDYQNKKEENIYNRLLNSWPKAIDAIKQSPVFGQGLGSFDDKPAHIKHSDAHAHHSYLHILAELGGLGLTILLLMWWQVYRYIIEAKHLPFLNQGLQIAFWIIILSSFTEHRITTPAMLLPFSLVFCLYFAKNNSTLLKSSH